MTEKYSKKRGKINLSKQILQNHLKKTSKYTIIKEYFSLKTKEKRFLIAKTLEKGSKNEKVRRIFQRRT